MSWIERLQRRVAETTPPASATPRDEVNKLLDEAIDLGLRLIRKHGRHVPFCIAIESSGERTQVVADDRKVQDADRLYESVRQNVLARIEQGKFRAVALAQNVTYHLADDSKPRQAIRVTLDHIHDSGCTCYLPYRLIDGQVIPDKLFATEPVEKLFIDKATFTASANGEIRGR